MKKRYENRFYRRVKPFDEILKETHGHTMIGPEKFRMLYDIAIMTKYVPGDAAEAGVWAGGALYLLASVYDGCKIIHGFDSWEGLPGLTKEDCVEGTERVEGFYKGWGKIEPPFEYLAKFGARILLHKGWFADTLHDVEDTTFCLVHVDCDLYEPIKECCEFFVPRVNPGGWIIFDDYIDGEKWPGAVKAVDDYFAECHRKFEFATWSNNGVAMRFLE